MTSAELQILIQQHNAPDLAEQDGMVYQVWHDGEITLQKSGALLWSRNLHTIYPGFPGFDLGCLWANKHGDNSFIFTTEEGAKCIHRAIAAMAGKHPYC